MPSLLLLLLLAAAAYHHTCAQPDDEEAYPGSVPPQFDALSAPEYVEPVGPEPTEEPPQPIPFAPAYSELLIPEMLESNCARWAGKTLQCFAEHKGLDGKCDSAQRAHYDCVMREAASNGGYLNIHRVKRGRHGYFVYNPFDVYFGIAMELYGEWSELEWVNMMEYLHAGDVALDIGAHMGSLTVPMAQRVGDAGQLHAFEPQRVLHQLTTANMALNGIWNTKVHHVGVGKEPGVMKFETPGRMTLRNFGGMPLTTEATAYSHGEVEDVRIVTIDSFNFSRCDFFKIDVEGMEGQVIAGAMDTIVRLKPTLYFEDSGYGGIVPRDGVYRSDLVRSIERLGYQCYFDLQHYFNPNNFGEEKENFFQFSNGAPQVSTMILCVHPDRVPDMPDAKFKRVITDPPQ